MIREQVSQFWKALDLAGNIQNLRGVNFILPILLLGVKIEI